ncbi:hypothetical protein, partial [uncultured Lamprocystis sp.]|uniref:hypothetical protein n=1 Tax=uncultured Lamprocystis sp. TaxID=543132 RepID=UPI0025DC1A34
QAPTGSADASGPLGWWSPRRLKIPTDSAGRASKVATVTGPRRQRRGGADHHQVEQERDA